MDQIASFIQSELFTKLLAPATVVISFVVFCWRAGSFFSLLDRLWCLVAGNTEVGTPKLKELITETRDLERFRFLFRMKANHTSEIDRFKKWLDDNSIDIFTARLVARWIDLKSEQFVLPPSVGYVARRGIAALFFLVLLYVAIYVGLYSSGLFQMKASKIWFQMDQQNVQRIGRGKSVDLALCKNGSQAVQQQGDFSPFDADAICRSFNDNSLNRSVAEAMKEQYALGIVFSIASIVAFAVAMRELFSATEAISLRRRLDRCQNQATG
jgi:hypothetical protein